tara:strand:+ start:559 stop:1440 length:882 start_codon:yes stop_codon:yes gene_type:complete
MLNYGVQNFVVYSADRSNGLRRALKDESSRDNTHVLDGHMDFASIIGLIGALAFLSMGISDIGALIDPPSIYLVIGATASIMLYRSKLSDAISLGAVIGKVFFNKTEEPEELIDQLINLAQTARKDGLIALENIELSNRFLQSGVTSLVDGIKPELIEEGLEKAKELMAARHETGSDMLSAGAELAPGMGMIGTLIGLVNLLANLDDPSSIGPNMAIALLTTLYGSVLANVFFIPMGMKLEGYAKREANNNDLIILGIMFIKSGKNPRLLGDTLAAFMAPKARKKRETTQDAA